MNAAAHIPSTGQLIAMGILSGVILAGAILTITRRNVVTAVMALVATFFGIAGLYVMLSAPFLAAIQVLLYAGGIMVLFIFAVMVLNREEVPSWGQKGWFGKTLVSGLGVYLFLRIAHLLYKHGLAVPVAKETSQSPLGTVERMGHFLFKDYLFPFEAISLLLLVAIVAAVVIARSPASHTTSPYERQNLTDGSIENPTHSVSTDSHATISVEKENET